MTYTKFIKNLDNNKNRYNQDRFETIFPVIHKIHKIIITDSVDTLDDVLKLIKKYSIIQHVEYNIDFELLHSIEEPLEKLASMVGMIEIKNNIIDQILYYLQGLHNGDDYLHTIICGPPGTGKTEISKIIGEIFMKIGVLKNNKFRKVTRSDLVAGFLGQTAIKTKKVIDECLGGVLFIDEVYSLGNSDKTDSFSKECIDTLCEALSDHKTDIMVIVAGYEKEIKDCFFSYNQGLESRFIWKYKIEKYSEKELYEILQKKIQDIKWELSDEINETWFSDKIETFKYYGRDIELLVSKIKIAHSRRIFGQEDVIKKHITLGDINCGFEKLTSRDKINSDYTYTTMYT
jgi:SpoVK/Ycf46/Vps4 family AAA+-type ATPase